ncbi:MAG: amidohydrolase family protein [Methyloceanibacter sp.]
MHSNGVTTIAEPGALVTPQIYQFFAEQLNVDEVPFRTFFIPNGHGLYGKLKQENRLADLIQETKTFDSWGKGKVQWLPNQTKLFCDGAIFSQLMQLKDGYTDGHQGQWIAVPDDYRAAVKAYWDAGYQIHTHVNGDAGLDVVLGALEERMQANPRQDHRFTVVHFGVSEDDQVDRIARSGAVVSANPYYVSSLADKYSEIGLGPERANTMVRLGSCVERGLHVALHSDMPMAPAFPLLLAWCAANRTTASGRTAAPDQRIPVEKALEGITIEHAYINRLEDMIGSIKPGKKADFTILEQDPLSVAPQDLKDVKVWGTVFEGRVFPVAAPT